MRQAAFDALIFLFYSSLLKNYWTKLKPKLIKYSEVKCAVALLKQAKMEGVIIDTVERTA